MKIFILFILIISSSLSSVAQFNDNYTPLVCEGNIPLRLLLTTSEKYTLDKKEIKKSNSNKKEKRLKRKYSIESNFLIDNLMQSGNVLYNDAVSNYLNEIAQTLLLDENETIKSKIQVYTIRSTTVNAFATERGDIFVTLGLLSKLKNQSELAFVLAHEISHVLQSHNMNMYIKVDKLSKSERRNEETAKKNKIKGTLHLKKCLFSKEVESEADSLGIIRYLNAGYDGSLIGAFFDVLASSNLPFTNAAFPFEILENKDLKISTQYTLFQPQEGIKINELENDEENTHPNISKRRLRIMEAIPKITSQNKKLTLNDSKFSSVSLMAKLEMPMLYLFNQDYQQATYIASILLKDRPNNIYLRKCLAKSLYLFTKFKNRNEEKEILIKENTGSWQSVFNLFKLASKKEINEIAINYIWNLAKSYPNDKELADIKKDMQSEYFINVYALKTDSSSQQTFNILRDSLHKREFEELFVNLIPNVNTNEALALKKKSKKTQDADISTLLVLNPEYISIDGRRLGGIQYLQSEEGRLRIEKLMKFVGKKSKIQIQSLDMKQLDSNQSSTFNDIRQLNNWLDEQFECKNLNSIIGSNQIEVDKIASKYGTKYLLLSGVISIRKRNLTPYVIPMLAIFWPILPITLPLAMKPKYDMLHYSVLANISNGKMKVLDLNYFSKRDSDAMLKSHLYYTLYKLKKEIRKSNL